MENQIIKTLKGLKRNQFITDKQNKQFVDTYKGQSGWVIKSKPGSDYNYKITFRWQDLSFRWLEWENPWKDIWEVINNYPDKFLKWVKDTYGIDLLNCSNEDLLSFFMESGILEIEGEPSPYGYYKLGVLIRAMLNILEFSEAGVSK